VISRSQASGKNKEFLKFIEELKSLPISSYNEEGEVFQNVYFQEHIYYLNTGEFEKAKSLVPAIKSGLNKYGDKVNKARLLSFRYNIMVMYFLMNDFKESLHWANQIIDDRNNIKEDVLTVTRILLPVIYFELDYSDLLESSTRSSYRYLQSKNRLHDFEKVILKYLKTMPFTADKTELTTNLNRLRADIDEIISKPNQKLMLGMDEIMIWLSSKIDNKSMQSIILERAL
jgi:tetratricopeptide (TPR) repeat protein